MEKNVSAIHAIYEKIEQSSPVKNFCICEHVYEIDEFNGTLCDKP